MSEHPHDLAAAFALDALDGEERLAFEEHLSWCETCQTELTELREAAAQLGSIHQTAPPEQLKARVMTDLVGPARQTSRRARSLRERVAVPALAVVTLVSLVLAGLALTGLRTSDRAVAILSAEDARLTVLEGPSTAHLVYSSSLEEGLLLMTGVAVLSPDQTYELWLIGAQGAVPAGIFAPGAGTVRFFVEGDFTAASSVGITVEPAGGSPQPTGEVIYLGAIS